MILQAIIGMSRGKISLADIMFVDTKPHIFTSSYFEQGDPFIEEVIKTGKEIKVNV